MDRAARPQATLTPPTPISKLRVRSDVDLTGLDQQDMRELAGRSASVEMWAQLNVCTLLFVDFDVVLEPISTESPLPPLPGWTEPTQKNRLERVYDIEAHDNSPFHSVHRHYLPGMPLPGQKGRDERGCDDDDTRRSARVLNRTHMAYLDLPSLPVALQGCAPTGGYEVAAHYALQLLEKHADSSNSVFLGWDTQALAGRAKAPRVTHSLDDAVSVASCAGLVKEVQRITGTQGATAFLKAPRQSML